MPPRYRHFKGGLYEYISTARNSETGEPMVVYKSLNDDTLWVRPSTMFWGTVKVNGTDVPRFQLVTEEQDH